jgi:hypothetical protein
MLVRAPLVEAEQDGSIRIQDLTKVVMARRRLGLAENRLVPFEAARHVANADDRPCAFHRIVAVGLTRIEQIGNPRNGRIALKGEWAGKIMSQKNKPRQARQLDQTSYIEHQTFVR